jgi:hypothetical protein
MADQRSDHQVDCSGEVRAPLPISEKVNVAARAVADSVGANCVSTRQRKPERSSSLECDLRDRTMTWFHSDMSPTPQ